MTPEEERETNTRNAGPPWTLTHTLDQPIHFQYLLNVFSILYLFLFLVFQDPLAQRPSSACLPCKNVDYNSFNILLSENIAWCLNVYFNWAQNNYNTPFYWTHRDVIPLSSGFHVSKGKHKATLYVTCSSIWKLEGLPCLSSNWGL